MNHTELAWAAGFFNGEGCIYIHKIKKYGRYRHYLSISISQNGPPICLRRFDEAIMRLGHISGPCGNTYKLSNSSFEGAQAIIALLWKYMSKPKREQVKRVIAELKEINSGVRLEIAV